MFISREYKPEDYPLPLTPEQEEYLLEQATLEDNIRRPYYTQHERFSAERAADRNAAYETEMWFAANMPLDTDTSDL